MSKSFKVAALFAVTALILGAMVFAPSVYGQSSPTGTATAGVFTSDVEDSMDVHYYSDVEFDKWFGFIGTSGTTPSLGYATRFGDLYVGAWYTGTIASTTNSVTEQVVSDYDLDNQLYTGKTTTLTYSNQYTDSDNSLNVLIGVAGMGIKVGFSESLRVWSYPSSTLTTVEDATGAAKTYTNDYVVDDYLRIDGSMTPSLEWGTTIEAGDITIRPKVAAGLVIHRDTNILNTKATYSTYNDELVGGTEQINRVNGTVNDYLGLGAGVGADFGLNEKLSVGIGYNLYTNFYSNSYDGSGFSGTAAGTVSWDNGSTTITRNNETTVTQTTATLNIDEITNWSHNIEPSVYYSDEIAEGLTLGFSIALPVGITAGSSNSYYEWHQNTKTEYNSAVNKPRGTTVDYVTYGPKSLTETSGFSIGLNAAVGAQYALIPDRFTVKAGIGLNPLRFSSTTRKFTKPTVNGKNVTRIYDADGNQIGSDVVSLQEPNYPYNEATSDQVEDSVFVQNTWSPFGVYAAGGFTFNFNDSMALDMAVSGGSGSSNFTLNISNVKVLFSFKF